MAQIRKYTAQVGLSPSSIPTTRPEGVDRRGAELANFGNAISDVAAYFQQREETKENFKAENDYRKLNMDLENQMAQQAAEMTEDGTGFHDGFVKNVFGPAREKFLQSLPPRLRERYDTILADGTGADATKWSIKAAGVERDKLWSWYDGQLKTGQEELQTAISMDPDAYDQLYEQGIKEIDASGLPESQKEIHRKNWAKTAQLAHLDRMIQTRPEQVLRELGADPSMLTPDTQFNLVKSALINVETGGEKDPSRAISPKGAIGVMQVMPGTARDISKWMGDGLIDANMSDARITEILSNPVTNQRYGEFYLKKMIKDYAGRGGLEAALIAYNGGPARAEAWIKSGFDDSVLPKETRDYYKKVVRQLPTNMQTGQNQTAKGPKGDPANVKFVFNERKGLAKIAGQSEDNLTKDLTDRVRTAFASLGIDTVRINSGFRSKADNDRVGGAKGSQHLHGNAMDIDVSSYSIKERVELIRALSAAGITGLGIGANIIHADTAGRRAWGYARSSGGGAVPKWAQEAINEHLAGKAQPSGRTVGLSGRYSSVPYQERQKYIHAADRQLAQQQKQLNHSTALERTEIRRAMENEIASIAETGQTTGAVDDTKIATVLGEDDYAKWVDRRDTAQRMFGARDGIATMTLEEMDERLSQYRPDPGSPNYANEQRIEAAVEKEIDRVQKLRARNPAEAAMAYPDVKAAWDAVNAANGEPPAAAVKEFVRINLERQKEFGIKPGSEQPVPRSWAMEIGRTIAKIPELQGRNAADVNAGIIAVYDSLAQQFGEYTDEVIIYALREYKGVGQNTAEVISGYMQAIQAGGDPLARLRAQQDRALDADQVEATSGGFFSDLWDFIRGDRDEDAPDVSAAGPAPNVADAPSEELVLRARTAIDNLGDEFTPEQEEALTRRFGRKVMEAAKARQGTE